MTFQKSSSIILYRRNFLLRDLEYSKNMIKIWLKIDLPSDLKYVNAGFVLLY